MKLTRNSRKYERFPANGLLRFKFDPNSDHFQVHNIHEISEGGLSFLTPSRIEGGTTMGIAVLLFPQESPINMNATVVRCPVYDKKRLNYRACLRFLDLSAEDQQILRETLHRFFKSKSKRYVFRLNG